MNNFIKNKHLKIAVFYGSEKGYAESLAKDIYNSIKCFDKQINSLNNINLSDLNSYDFIIFVVSTNIEGSFPKNSQLFYNKLLINYYDLDFKYLIIGIGDTSYLNFCLPAKKIDNILHKTNCKKILHNLYLDDSLDHELNFLIYKNKIIKILKNEEVKIKEWFTKSMNNNFI